MTDTKRVRPVASGTDSRQYPDDISDTTSIASKHANPPFNLYPPRPLEREVTSND